MQSVARMTDTLLLAAAYFIAAALAIAFTRFTGGFAFLWGSSAVLIAALVRLPYGQWKYALVACAAAGSLASGLWGLGWAAAPYMTLVNLTEAGVAAWLMRRSSSAGRALESLDWLVPFVLAAGIAGPLVSAILAAGWMAMTGGEVVGNFLSFLLGHGLGNLTFTPLALLVMGARARRSSWQALQAHRQDVMIFLPILVLTTLVVFVQRQMPLLFLPILPIMLFAFRTGREGAALSIALLAIIGGGLSAAGFGPTQMLGGGIGFHMLFFQLYLATVVLTVLPLSADLHQRRALNRKVRESEERFRLLADYSTDIIMNLEPNGRIRYVSPAIRTLGYTHEELIGRNCAILIAPEHLAEATKGHLRTIDLAGETSRFEYFALAKDGSRFWCETHARMIVNEDGGLDGMVSIVRGIDERKRNEERLHHAAMTDPLTGLANRRAFRDRVGAELQNRRADKGICIAVFDIDHFKRVNDRHGHDAGDEVLKAFANMASTLVRKQDIIARLGGEEFGIFFPDTAIEQALAVCDRLRSSVATAPICVGGETIRVTVSGGVAMLGPAGLDQALKDADKALYEAKNGGRDQLALAA